MSARPRELGFADGARAFFGGVGWILGTPSIWALAAIPTLLALALIGGTTWGAFTLGWHFIERAGLLTPGGVTVSILRAIVGILLFVVSVVLGFVVGFSLAQPLAAPALDRLAKKRAQELGVTQFVETRPLATIARSVRVVGLALLVGVPILLALSLVTLLVPAAGVVTVPAKFVVAAWLATWDVFDYAFGLEALGIRARLAWLSRHGTSAFAFGLALAAVALVPGLGLLVLPFGVAGATELWVKSRG